MTRKEDLPYCPVATTLQIMGSKWKLWILQELEAGPARFSQLEKKLPGISRHVLSSTLKSMLEDGIISRRVVMDAPLSVEYSLSEIGRSLEPVLEAMKTWGLEYKKFYGEAREDQ